MTDRATRAAIGELYLPHWEAYLEETGVAALVDIVPVLRGAARARRGVFVR